MSTAPMTTVPTIDLRRRSRNPAPWWRGVQIASGETERAVSVALEVGYRHIDTAQMYGSLKGVVRHAALPTAARYR
jgi:2,5-diketo-D-gluconate reductase A